MNFKHLVQAASLSLAAISFNVNAMYVELSDAVGAPGETVIVSMAIFDLPTSPPYYNTVYFELSYNGSALDIDWPGTSLGADLYAELDSMNVGFGYGFHFGYDGFQPGDLYTWDFSLGDLTYDSYTFFDFAFTIDPATSVGSSSIIDIEVWVGDELCDETGCEQFDPGMTDSAMVTVSSVPIPAAVWLFGSGLLGLVGMARRKKAV
ncbi:MAG: VPLPA-CTERM sorting domain-containing protein [Nitrosomonadaceae bacterium]